MPPRKVHPAKKGSTIDSNPPPLLVSFRAHLKSVVSLDFVDRFHLIITGSKDASVRLWTQTGRYIGMTKNNSWVELAFQTVNVR